MFFDNEKFFSFQKACKNAGIDVPIVPGIKPITKKYQLNSIPRKFFVNFPEQLVEEVMRADEKDVQQIGIEWCVSQCKELISAGIPCLHFYTMGDTATIFKIVEKSL